MVSLHKLDNFQATTMDLGTFEQEFWKISHGHWRAFSSVFQTPAISVDGSLAIYPLAYGFRFLGGAPFLFVVQAMGTALTAWGLYRAARLHQLSEGVASLTASLFLLYPAVLGGSQFDFHTDFLALPSLVWAYVYYGSSRRATYYSLLLCAALSKNMALFSIAGWGMGLVIYKRQVRDGLIAIFASAVLFVLEMDVLFPLYFRGPVQQVDRSFYGYLGHSLSGIVLGILVHFGAVVHHLLQQGPYFLWIFGPVLAVALFGSASVPAMLSGFFLNALSAFSAQHAVQTQYQVILAGWVFLALIESVVRFRARRQWFVLCAVGFSTLLFEALLLASTIFPLLRTSAPVGPDIRAALQTIGRQSVVFTQNRVGPLAYKFPLLGIDRAVAPGWFVDTLPVLWREVGHEGAIPTALVAVRPVSPYLANLIAQALQAGYRVSFHRGPVFVVAGDRPFPVSPPEALHAGWQPDTRSWTIPAWTQFTRRGHIDWRRHVVKVSSKEPGVVFPGIWMQLGPGFYQITVMLTEQGPRRPSGQILGVMSFDAQRVLLRSGQRSVTLKLRTVRPVLSILSLTSRGTASFGVQNFLIQRTQYLKISGNVPIRAHSPVPWKKWILPRLKAYGRV